MGKNILIVTGSPRRQGNSDMLADAFIEGATAADHHTDKYEAAFHKLNGCRACGGCWSKGGPCALEPEFNTAFAPLVEKADALVFAIPLYFYGFPAQAKATLDKLYAYVVPQCQTELHIREAALLICGDDEEQESYGGAVENYRQILRYRKWTDRGIITAGGMTQKGMIAGTGFLEQAKQLGRDF